MQKEKKFTAQGYLPDESPSPGKLILYALQQVIVMFPATVTVALVTAGKFPCITAPASPI